MCRSDLSTSVQLRLSSEGFCGCEIFGVESAFEAEDVSAAESQHRESTCARRHIHSELRMGRKTCLRFLQSYCIDYIIHTRKIVTTQSSYRKPKKAIANPSPAKSAKVEPDAASAAFVFGSAGVLALVDEFVLLPSPLVAVPFDLLTTAQVLFAFRKSVTGRIARITSKALKSWPNPCVPSHFVDDQSCVKG